MTSEVGKVLVASGEIEAKVRELGNASPKITGARNRCSLASCAGRSW